jgi:hypothetical protein
MAMMRRPAPDGHVSARHERSMSARPGAKTRLFYPHCSVISERVLALALVAETV